MDVVFSGAVDRKRFFTRAEGLVAVAMPAIASLAASEIAAVWLLSVGWSPWPLLIAILILGLSLTATIPAYLAYRRLRGLTFDGVGIHWSARGRERVVRWSEVSRVSLFAPQQGLPYVRIDGDPRVQIRLSLLQQRRALLRLIKEMTAHAYELDDAEEALLLAGTPHGIGVGGLAWATESRRDEAAYREPALPSRVNALRHFLSATRRYCATALMVCVASSAAAIALMPRGHPLLALLALAVALFSCLFLVPFLDHAIRIRSARRREVAFVGDDAVAADHIVSSKDGARRIRSGVTEMTDPYAGGHVHLEELDPLSSTTTRTYVCDRGVSLRLPIASAHVRVAIIRATSWVPRCFDGAPSRDAKPFGEPRVLMLRDTVEGVLLTRFTRERRYAGDTLHATRAEAELQIRDEIGVHDVEWRDVELTAPWAFWPAALAAEDGVARG